MVVKKKKHPVFKRPNYGRKSRSRIKKNWRAPRGIDNKMRLKIAYMGGRPSIGYRNAREVRGLHPTGYPEVLAARPQDIEGKSNVVIRIASGVGKLKRMAIEKRAAEMKLRVLN
jgi:large subunit ribosomal protein L32e